jgi:hypothetical protein
VRTYDYHIPEPADLGKFVGHFIIYGDEAGKLASSDYTSFCGFVGSADEWARVSGEWTALRIAWGVPPLHMRCVMQPDRPGCQQWADIKARWGSDWDDKRDDMLKDFGAVIRHSNLAAMGCVVDSAHFRAMPDSLWKRQHQNPIYLSLFTLIGESLDRIDVYNKHLSVSLVVDDDEECAMNCYKFLNSMKKQLPRFNERITAITFGNDNEYPGLQMADMLAYEARNFMVNQLKNVENPLTPLLGLLTKMGVNIPKIWTAEFLDKAAKVANEKEI